MNATHSPGERDVLLIVDVQNDFCPGGALAVPNGDEIMPVVNRLARRFAHIVMTQQPFGTIEVEYGTQTLWPDHCVQGTIGAEFHPGLDIAQVELIIRKGYRAGIDSYSAFRENDRRTPTGLAGYLRERRFERVTLCGLALDYCVFFSAIDAREAGFETSVALEACRGIDLDGSQDRVLAAMRNAGITLSG